MDTSLVVKNIVWVGEFNPSKYDKFFFIKNGIFNEDQILEGSVFTNDISFLITPKFNLSIFTNQIIIDEVNPSFESDLAILGHQIANNMGFKASAMGINFHWYIFSNEETDKLTKQYFFNPNNALNQFFSDDDHSSYGYYVSKNIGKSRLKLDIKPATVAKVDTKEELKVIMFTFNFHTDLVATEILSTVNSLLKEFPQYENETKKIMALYE